MDGGRSSPKITWVMTKTGSGGGGERGGGEISWRRTGSNRCAKQVDIQDHCCRYWATDIRKHLNNHVKLAHVRETRGCSGCTHSTHANKTRKAREKKKLTTVGNYGAQERGRSRAVCSAAFLFLEAAAISLRVKFSYCFLLY